jgi:hypothetical protein
MTLGADKFNASGLRVAVYLSDTATPPTDWTTCREGTEYIPDETVDTVTLGILASRATLIANATNSSGDYTVAFSPAISANNAYLYVIVSLYDYEDYRASREYYIEGSGVLDGANVEVGFAAAATPDATPVAWDGRYKAGGKCSLFFGASFAWLQNNRKLLFTRNSMEGEEGLLGVFPSIAVGGDATETYTQFDGNAETLIGVESGGKISGCTCVRVIKLINGEPITTLQFGEAVLCDLAGKQLNLHVNVWYGKLAETTPAFSMGYGTPADATMKNENLYFSDSISGAKLKAYSTSWIESAEMTLTHAGQFTLRSGKQYTSSDVFPVSISGAGIYCLIVAVAPSTISNAAAGATTNVIFKPGEFLYLS